MKKLAEKTQEGAKVTLENIQEVMKAIEGFFTQQQENHQRNPSIEMKRIEGDSAQQDAVKENGLGCIRKHITEIQLPGFTKNEFILAKKTFIYKEGEHKKIKYVVQFGYLWKLADHWKGSVDSYTIPFLLKKAQENCFTSYIELETKGNDNSTSFVIVVYNKLLYLCLNGTWLFQYDSNTVNLNPDYAGTNHETILYMQKFGVLRQKIQQDIEASQNKKSKSPEIATILKNLEF